MNEKQTEQPFEEKYNDLLKTSPDPAFAQIIQELDAICTAPQLPASVVFSFSIERKQAPLDSIQASPEIHVIGSPKSTLLRSTHKKLPRSVRLVALVATLAIVLGALSAASFSLGWWASLFGNPNLYATINQRQVHHGVTIEITKVYADEGRTIIAYDTFSNDSAKRYIPNNFDLVGSAPQKQETLSGTYGEGGTDFFYMVQPPFLVPANVHTLTLTLNIGNVLVTQSGKGATPSSPIMGPWHFVFTVPFHHENNTHIVAPSDGDVFTK